LIGHERNPLKKIKQNEEIALNAAVIMVLVPGKI
jgi:hypothetical protein